MNRLNLMRINFENIKCLICKEKLTDYNKFCDFCFIKIDVARNRYKLNESWTITYCSACKSREYGKTSSFKDFKGCPSCHSFLYKKFNSDNIIFQ